MADPIPILEPSTERPFLDERNNLTQESRSWTFDLTDLQIIFGNGSPEGVVEAVDGRLYRDRANIRAGADLWYKRTDSICGDNTLGWVLNSGLSGNGVNLV